MFGRKRQNVEVLLERYFDSCNDCYAHFAEAMRLYFEAGPSPEFEAEVGACNKVESSCDDQRREIEYLLYGKALLPESRGDLLGLLETFDRLPNMAETVGFLFAEQRLVMPEELQPMLRDLVELNIQAYHLARKCVDTLMTNPRSALHATAAVDQKESESDRLERRLIRAIFARDDDAGTKLLYQNAVLLIGSISDRAEQVADRVAIVSIKRQV